MESDYTPPLNPRKMKKNSTDVSTSTVSPDQREQTAVVRDQVSEVLSATHILEWQPQEVPFGHPESCCRFDIWSGEKAVVSTPAAIALFGHQTVVMVLEQLRRQAEVHHGLDYLQVFCDQQGNKLWVIEDGQAITALLPQDY
jgi:hypothetical protein